MSQVLLDGPRLAPLSGQPARQLVVLIHGYGASGDDLIGLGEVWRERLPDAAFVAPNAPERLPGFGYIGYQWFELTLRDPSEYWRGVTAAGPALDRFLDKELARLGLDDAHLALVGFSQGTMMALHVGLRRRAAPAGILAFSGRLAGPERLGGEITVRPPVLLIHGAEDEVIAAVASKTAQTALEAAGVSADLRIHAGLGHGIDDAGLAAGAAFLANALG